MTDNLKPLYRVTEDGAELVECQTCAAYRAQCDALRQQADRLAEALVFYAGGVDGKQISSTYSAPVYEDHGTEFKPLGAKARQALAKYKGEGGGV